MANQSIHDIARGKWDSILPILGVPVHYLTGKHTACPICGGKDRFRWDNKGGSGSYFCGNQSCGPGSGVDLVMKVNGWDFLAARARIAEEAGVAPVRVPKAATTQKSAIAEALWSRANPLTGFDPASLYLHKRGLRRVPLPVELRYMENTTYLHDDKSKTRHAAMIARFLAPDAASYTVHVTYIDDAGNKADVPKVRKLAPGSIPKGGAVRLASEAETMGIGEGIETALSAMKLHDVPVWAALNVGNMTKWQPPAVAKNILIFADEDSNYAGQYGATALAHRLVSEGYRVEIRWPGQIDTDWNDVLISEAA